MELVLFDMKENKSIENVSEINVNLMILCEKIDETI